eukprot:TRINITY_DN3548_c0_g1_i2.p1 TRINITY_DN3548_c0_g1~~TRINITY_DN3548_c0_g1_i2.p1  ORF type:complete len:289 (-),score=44.49 TRINITY_DN3548_c0_g1_i2:70-936(-)
MCIRDRVSTQSTGAMYSASEDEERFPEEEALIGQNTPSEPGVYSSTKKNFPICYPILYHNISADIPPEHRFLVRLTYTTWYAIIIAYIVNSIALGSIAFSDGGSENIIGWVLSIVFILVGPIFAFCVYKSLYNGCKTGKSSYYVLFLCFFIMQLLLEIFFAVGLKETGASGFVLMIEAFENHHTIPGFLQLISCLIWLGMASISIFITWSAKRAFYGVGGPRKFGEDVGRDAAGFAASTAADHKEEIAKAAWENRATIYKVATTEPEPEPKHHGFRITDDDVPEHFLS